MGHHQEPAVPGRGPEASHVGVSYPHKSARASAKEAHTDSADRIYPAAELEPRCIRWVGTG